MKPIPVISEAARGTRSPPGGSGVLWWHPHVKRVLISKARLARRVRELAREIEQDLTDPNPVFVPLLNGTFVFAADLLRHLGRPASVEFMGTASYREGTRPGRLAITRSLQADLAGREVVVVDDILDTGRTLEVVVSRLQRLGPRRLRVCVLLEKAVERQTSIHADHVGFRIPDVFVVGYGLDHAGRFRNLPWIGVLRPGPEVTPASRFPSGHRVSGSGRGARP